MDKKISPALFAIGVIIAIGILLCGSVLLPHDRYYRYQAHNSITTRHADWIYERLHFDPKPVHVALVGSSRTIGWSSAPKIEQEFCKQTGKKINVANLGIPYTGRNMHYVIAKEALRTKQPALMVVELNEIETRRPHYGFIFLADPADVITAPALLNLNYIVDFLRLPGRQVALFYKSIFNRPDIRSSFDPQKYLPSNRDMTQTVDFINGQSKSRDVVHHRDALEEMRTERANEVSPLHLLPKPLRPLEYRFSRAYLRKIESMAEKHASEMSYVYLPAYHAPVPIDGLLKELDVNKPIIDLGGSIAFKSSLWLDATHLNADGAITQSKKFAQQLAQQLTQGENFTNTLAACKPN